MYGRVTPSLFSNAPCNSGSGRMQLKLSWSQPKYTTETFDSGTLYNRTRSAFEWYESVITRCDNFAADQKKNLNRRFTGLARRETMTGIRSWMVPTEGAIRPQ